MRMRWIAFVVMAGIAGCQPAPETSDALRVRLDSESAAARQAIEASNKLWSAHMLAGHSDSVAMRYAENGRLMPPNEKEAVGRVAVAAVVAAFAKLGKVEMALTTVDVAANGPMALERGTWKLTITPPGGAPINDNGKYIVHWQKAGDDWKMLDDIWNGDNPPVPPVPEVRKR